MSIEQSTAETTDPHACGCGGACGGGGARAQADAAAVAATRGAGRDLGLVAASVGGPDRSAPHDSAPATGGPRAEPGDLDARAIPRSVRRQALIAAVGALPPGEHLVIAADHDPAHLGDLLTRELGRPVDLAYLRQGPDLWRVRVAPRAR